MFRFLILICLSLKAFAAPGEITYDKYGMPRCIASAIDSEKSLIFFWDASNQYTREIFVSTIEKSHLVDKSAFQNCASIKRYFDFRDFENQTFSDGVILKPDVSIAKTEVEEFRWSKDVNAAFDQIRLGANTFRKFSAEDFVKENLTGDFTREINRQLVRKYGIGFSADVFQAWLLGQGDNLSFAAKIDSAISGHLSPARLSEYRVLVAQGYMQTEKSDRLENLLNELHAFGVSVVEMNFDPVGRVSDNAKRFHDQIAEELKTSQKIILISASKGSPEVLTALSALNDEKVDLSHVKAVLTLAAMIDGSFLVDWADHLPQKLMVKKALASDPSGVRVTNLDGFFDMSSEFLAQQSAAYHTHLPDLRYFSFVGILTQNGLARDQSISMLQKSLSIAKVGQQGANDGYIEYPGTAFPKAWGLRSTDFIFDSSHAILDGSYRGHNMQDASERKIVLDAIFEVILEDIEKL